ncbi:MAG: hypothetical protein LIP09_03265 [Bacteroidales bacterium]|nr:hypothetical protein [Bacteroidales bacterium]
MTTFFTSIYIEGAESDLIMLHQVLKNIEKSYPDVVYGQWWLGLLAENIGYPTHKVDHRSGIDSYGLENGILEIYISTPANEEKYFIKYFVNRFPELEFTVIIELEDYSYASTNDVKGTYVPYRYRILIGDQSYRWVHRGVTPPYEGL